MKTYQAIFSAPFGVLGICCEADALTGIEFLPPEMRPLPPRTVFSRMVCDQLAAYFASADFHFDIPFNLNGTEHRSKVWQALRAIPNGQTRYYGELAQQIASSPRAVGQACGANPLPVVIPCHRVIGKAGIGGFMHQRNNFALNIKRWLLAHESTTFSPLMGKG